MPEYLSPGVYVEEVPSAIKPIAGVSTSTAAFIGVVPDQITMLDENPNFDPTRKADDTSSSLRWSFPSRTLRRPMPPRRRTTKPPTI